MASLTAIFSTPQSNRAYWHDHLGLCVPLSMSEYTSLDHITVAKLRQGRINQLVECDLDQVYTLPVDRMKDLTEIPHCRHICQHQKVAMNRSLKNTHRLDVAISFFHETFFLEPEAYDFLSQMKAREKSENFAVRDENPMYRAQADLCRNAQVFLELSVIIRKAPPADLDDFVSLASQAVEKVQEINQGRTRVRGAMERTAQHNLR